MTDIDSIVQWCQRHCSWNFLVFPSGSQDGYCLGQASPEAKILAVSPDNWVL